MKRILAAVLSLVLAVALMAGCNGDAAPELDDARLDNLNLEGMPIVNDPIEISVMTMRWGDMGTSFAANQWLVDLEAESNINVDWQARSSSDWEEQRSIMFAGGAGMLPDVFFGNMTIPDGVLADNIEFFIPLNDLIENYMPNYRRMLETFPSILPMTTHPCGNIFSLAKNLPARPATQNQPMINMVWLEALGLDVPTTYRELTDVLVAFVENDASGQGRTFGLSGEGDISVDFLAHFGITDIFGTMMSVLDGETFFYPTSEQYKAGIIWLRELWELGVLDNEMFTQDRAMHHARFNAPDGPIVGLTFQWTPDAITGANAYQFAAIPPIIGPDGRQFSSGDPDGIFSIMRNEAHITIANQNPEATARWLDQFYTNEATIQNFWGAINTVITANPDGTFVLNDPPEGVSADAWYWDQSLRDFGPGFVEPGFTDRILLNPYAGDGYKLTIAQMSDPFVTTPFPQLIYTSAENEELAFLETDIGTFVDQTRARWITQGGIEEEWDDYIATLNAMGLERFIEIRMGALERAQ